MEKRIIALIPAKYNSKSIKKKNFQKINKKTLVEIAIDQSKRVKLIDQIFLNSENVKIKKIAEQKKIKFFLRDQNLSKFNTRSEFVISDFIKKQKLNDDDIIVYLQPTSPFRTAKHINESLKKFMQKPNLSLISVKKNNLTIFKSVKKISNFMKPIFSEKLLSKNRQSFPDTFLPNGAIYIFKIKEFKKKKNIPVHKFQPYIMNNIESLDIDNLEDLKYARKLSIA